MIDQIEDGEKTKPRGTEQSANVVRRLISLAVAGLMAMFDASQNLFCYRRILNGSGLVNEGLSRRYTIITLLGLDRYETHGGKFPIDLKALWKRLFESSARIDNIGDLGLMIWLIANNAPGELEHLFKIVELKNSLRRYRDSREGRTTELSWFLGGLSHAALALGRRLEDIDKLAYQVYGLLKQNYGGRGIFRHMGKASPIGKLRGRIGSFADQIYPIYAFSKFGEAYDSKGAIDIAIECARSICNLQGSVGQWWWHYDAITERVLGRYPVYSVHQDGMAPMALFELSKVTGLDFETNIYKGLEWITGKNELGINLINESNNLIWRNVYLEKFRMYSEEMLSLVGINTNRDQINKLKVLYECRPYHLGWLLYAFAGTKD